MEDLEGPVTRVESTERVICHAFATTRLALIRFIHRILRGEPNRTHLVTASELAVALLATLLTLAAALFATLATLLSALLNPVGRRHLLQHLDGPVLVYHHSADRRPYFLYDRWSRLKIYASS